MTEPQDVLAEPRTEAGKVYANGSQRDMIQRYGHGYTLSEVIVAIENEAAALVRTPETLDVERLAKALHESSPDSHRRRACRDRHDLRAADIAAEYAAASPAPDPGAGLDAAWREAEAALPEGVKRAISIGQYPPDHESAGDWVALVVYAPHFYGDGPTPAAALLALAAALRLPKPEGDR